ncbi:four-carbon acid sugar kinase family protein [Acaryochloris sp. IP29b_bin.148]|uniref:four-carbon acid sugar kinase family protein n=1 Tax=Acaryochloris sp. IP29b_bin.148 TaxID=2969218 RepID=UPI0026142BDB|nr:four-carbon acid sugar kinase family protein [Acaryochloris sp. IP29b_bin.148]
MAYSPKIVVLDDDPTGSQTVHSCLLLLQWDVATLCQGLLDPSPLLFILTNTRARSAAEAAQVTREVCRNLNMAMAQVQSTADGTDRSKSYLIVSRSDSTLRGHYPLETDVITAELGPFDAQFLVPAFLEGGRITQNGMHYIQSQDRMIPVHQTEFAQDPIFGYQHSFLPDYIAEKTEGRVSASQVLQFSVNQTAIEDLNPLMSLQGNQYTVVDAVHQADLDQFAQWVFAASAQGKRFLFRSAASLLTALANLPPQPIPAGEMGKTVQSDHPGVFIIGSYVQKTTAQLSALLALPQIEGIELNLTPLQENEVDTHHVKTQVLAQIDAIFRHHHTPVIYTSRQPLNFTNLAERLRFSTQVANLLADIVQQLPTDLGYLVSKGGMTSNILLSRGLNLSSVQLLGQILPGCCVVQTSLGHNFPQLPVVLFPGNVGQTPDLVKVYQCLSRRLDRNNGSEGAG